MYNLKTTKGRHPPIALATWNCWARPLSSKQLNVGGNSTTPESDQAESGERDFI
jgi:hypothetical protein